MARRATGYARLRGEKWYGEITLGRDARSRFHLATCHDEAAAKARVAVLAELVARLRAANQDSLAPRFVERAASAEEQDLHDILRAVDRVVRGQAFVAAQSSVATFESFATDWTEGRLHARWPDQVKLKRSVGSDRIRLVKHVYPIVGHVPIAEFSVDHADAVMRSLPPNLTAASRRHVAQAMHRVLGLAVYPARLIGTQPLPKGFLPPMGTTKALTYLYPDEEAALLGATNVALGRRVLYAVLSREGLRRSEAERLTWADLDLERGALTLDTNKTDDPRAWALNPCVTRALAKWKVVLGKQVSDTAQVFMEPGGRSLNLERAAEQLRDDLQAAGITRAVLFEQSATRQPIRVHDLRATFVTIALANGRNEAWVMDRTGHTTGAMVHRYRRAARTCAELGMGTLAPMDVAIPELAKTALTDLGRTSIAPAIAPNRAIRGSANRRNLQ